MGRQGKGVSETLAGCHYGGTVFSRSLRARDAMDKNTDLDAERRALWRRYWRDSMAHYEACEARWQAWRANPKGRPPDDPFPEVLRGLTCGARTRAGTPCKRTDLYRSGRCKLHGGLSTGPTSPEGKAIASRNAKRTP